MYTNDASITALVDEIKGSSELLSRLLSRKFAFGFLFVVCAAIVSTLIL